MNSYAKSLTKLPIITKWGKMYSGKKQTKNIGYKNTQRQTVTMPCEQ